ncbi:MAG: hypothetical protein WA971_12985, partial [Microbacterium sp.]
MEAATTVPRAPHALTGTTITTMTIGAATVLSGILLPVIAPPALVPPAEYVAVCAISGFLLVLAGVVARKAPGNVTGPLLVAQALVVLLVNSVQNEALGAFAGCWMLLYLPLGLVLIVTPAGRAASPRWRAVAVSLCAVAGLFVSSIAVGTLIPQTAAALTIIAEVLLPVFFGLLIACATAPFARYRHAGEPDRLRLRWVLVAGLSLPLTLLLCWSSYLVLGTPDLVVFGLIAMMIAIPAGATIAIVAPHLFDIDRVIVSVATALVLVAAALTALSVA